MSTTVRNILIVDDEPGDVDAFRDVLEPHGYSFRVCSTKEDARAALSNWQWDLALIDLRLSDNPADVSGFELLREAKQLRRSNPVIMATKYHVTTEIVVECMRNGAYYYYHKPDLSIRPERFVKLVEEAMAYRSHRDLIEDSYPHPLALLYRDVRRNVIAPQLRFTRLIELTEATLKFCGFMCISELLSEGPNALVPFKDSIRKLRRPSMGAWLEFVRTVWSGNPGSPLISSILARLEPTAFRALERSVQLRNDAVGHGASQSDREYDELIGLTLGPLEALLGQLSPIGSCPLVSVQSTEKLGPGQFRHTVFDLRGHNPRFVRTNLDSRHECEVNKPALVSADDKSLIIMHPFLMFADCETCGQRTLFFFDKLDRERVYYLDYVSGHRMIDRNGGRSLDEIFSM